MRRGPMFDSIQRYTFGQATRCGVAPGADTLGAVAKVVRLWSVAIDPALRISHKGRANVLSGLQSAKFNGRFNNEHLLRAPHEQSLFFSCPDLYHRIGRAILIS